MIDVYTIWEVLMKTVVCKRYGEPEVLEIETVDKPMVAENEVLVKIMASSISKVDIAFREGKPLISRAFTGLTKPKYSVPGDCIAGIVEEVGTKVTAFESGDKIYGHTGLSFGGHGEYLTISQNETIVRMPDGMTFVEAAAFAYSAMTALPFVRDHALLKEGKTILVNGAADEVIDYTKESFSNRKDAFDVIFRV